MKDNCPSCGESYKWLGQHWRYNPKHRPDFTDYQKDVITGVLMGDGNINISSSGKPRLRVTSINKEYLEYLDNIFGVHSVGVELKQSAEYSANLCSETGFSKNAKAKNYSDIYELRTRNSPNLQQFQDWYANGKKEWPDIELTPTILKNLYVCDGSLNTANGKVVIYCSNERENKDKIERIFKNCGIRISCWSDRERDVEGYKGTISTSLNITKGERDRFFEYIGEPLPGFEYKWPEKYK